VSARQYNALVAIVLGLILAVIFFVPFVVVNYRRRGRLSPARTLTWVAFLIYFLAVWTFTLLPLPDPADITCQGHNLRPGEFLDRIRAYDTSSPTALLRNPGFLEFAYNILLFVPLGFLIRLLWRRGAVFTLALGLVWSAFIELTQATGVWGIYPCAFRYGEIDDLISNGFGALIGGILSWPVARLVRFDDAPLPGDRPTHVSRGRRLVAMACDGLTAVLLGLAVEVGLRAVQLYVYHDAADAHLAWLVQNSGWLVPLGAGLVAVTASGRTPGDWAVGLRFERPGEGAGGLAGRWLRFVAGVGGWLALSAWSDTASLVFAAVSLVATLVTAQGRGLPGLVTGRVPTVVGPQ